MVWNCDGRYSLEAIIMLMKENENWAKIRCIDTVAHIVLAVKNTDSSRECKTPDIPQTFISGLRSLMYSSIYA